MAVAPGSVYDSPYSKSCLSSPFRQSVMEPEAAVINCVERKLVMIMIANIKDVKNHNILFMLLSLLSKLCEVGAIYYTQVQVFLQPKKQKK